EKHNKEAIRQMLLYMLIQNERSPVPSIHIGKNLNKFFLKLEHTWKGFTKEEQEYLSKKLSLVLPWVCSVEVGECRYSFFSNIKIISKKSRVTKLPNGEMQTEIDPLTLIAPLIGFSKLGKLLD
ncbi:hypothetical protein KKB44_04370, partial [Candidatus Micrarchaeota archaeon]|nr:hypothetical protein [Candidatus Micrarchaeota archaeon]